MRVNKSIKTNVVMNAVKTLMGIIFPLISFPYASRVLGTVGIGKVNYVVSLANYFVLLASLGIPTYAIREGGRIRDDKEKLGKFVTEMFIINLITTGISLFIFICITFIPSLSEYKALLYIVSILIPFTTLGMSWLYQILEDYTRITVQTIVFQAISLFLLVLLVRDSNSYCQYAFVHVFSTVGSNLLFFINAHRHVKLFGYKNYQFSTHLKAIFTIFAMTIASTIYLNMDITMLGAIKGDSDTGIYSAAMKLNNIVCNLISSMSSVILARLSYYMSAGEKDKFNSLIKQTSNSILALAVPCAVGMSVISRELIILISGVEFVDGSLAMQILSLRVVLSPLNGFMAYQIFMPLKKEKFSFIATIAGCIINIVLNAVFIPYFSYNGAAIATVLAEIAVFIVCIYKGKVLVNFSEIFSKCYQYVLASFGIILTGVIGEIFVEGVILKCIIVIAGSVCTYVGILLLLKNEFATKCMEEILKIVGKRRKK